MRSASCCFHGVAPIRKPVFRSCEVSPALAEAMQTTPPIVMASAPKAGAVQPFTRKIAEVAISVAMVIPEMGLAELPIRPTMREETVTNKNSKHYDQERRSQIGKQAGLRAGNGLEGEEQEHQHDQQNRSTNDDGHGEVAIRTFFSSSGSARFADGGNAFAKCTPDGRQGAKQGEDSGCGDCACSHGANVGGPQITGRHLRNGLRARIDRSREMRSEKVDGGH